MNAGKKITNLFVAATLFVALGAYTPAAFSMQVAKNEDGELNLGGVLQTYGFVEQIRDPYSWGTRLYLFQKLNRVRISGEYKEIKYNMQLALGGEETVKNLNASMSLLDSYIDIPICGDHRVRAGQFKVPYSRERLEDIADLNYADRSINTVAFNVGRDVGFAFYGNHGIMTAAFGVFTAGGIDIPIRNLPQKLGIPMLALRVGINNNLDKDIFGFNRVDFDATDTRSAVYVNGIYTRNSEVGHSTALANKTNDKSLLINSNWNPYTTTTNDSELWQTGADFAMQTALGNSRLLLNAEFNAGRFSSSLGSLNIYGGVIGGNLYFSPAVGIGLRYAAIIPSKNFGYKNSVTTQAANLITGVVTSVTTTTTYPIIKDETPIQEITPSLIINLKNNIRVVFDAPIGFDVPVAQEKNNGTYNLMFQPDQTSYVTSEGITRETTAAGRMVFQFVF